MPFSITFQKLEPVAPNFCDIVSMMSYEINRLPLWLPAKRKKTADKPGPKAAKFYKSRFFQLAHVVNFPFCYKSFLK